MNALARSLVLPCGLTLPNRIAKAATSEALASAHALPTELHHALYHRFAKGGAGLLVTGNIMVDRARRVARGDVALDGATTLAPFSSWAKAVGAPTGFFAQLNHPGRQVPRALDPKPVAPSATPLSRRALRPLFATPRALRAHEILAIVDAFAIAAERLREAGFSGVQIHAAHGYLVHQFLSRRVNQREDEWGESAAGRRRFLMAIIDAIRARVPSSFAVAVKLDGGTSTNPAHDDESDERLDLLAALADSGVDLVELSGGTYEHDQALGRHAPRRGSERARDAEEAYFFPFAESARARVKIPLALTGGFRSFAAMNDAVSSGIVDVVGLARPLILDPGLPQKLLRGENVHRPIASPSLGGRFLDAAAELFVYEEAIHRLARGELTKEPALASRRIAALALSRRLGG